MERPSRSLVIKALLLLGALISIALISSLTPSLGILFVGFIVILIIELTRLRYPQNTVEKSLIILSLMTLVWGWVGPHMQSLSKPLSALMLTCWGVHCLSVTPKQSFRIFRPSIVIILALTIIVFLQDAHDLVSPLLWGYDNSAHVPALSQVYRHGGFIYSGDLPLNFTFSNYVNGYPPLQQSSWAFILSIANIQISGGYEILDYYGFFFFGIGLLTIALISANLLQTKFFDGKHSIFKLFVLIVAVLIGFSQISYIFWMGFPPFIWATCIILALVRVISNEPNQSYRVLLGILGLTLVNYSYPLLSPVLVLIILFEIIKMSKTDFIFCWANRYAVIAIGLFISVLNVAVVMKSLVVRNYLNDDGGIQPIAFWNLFAVFALVLLALLFNRYSLKSLPLFVVAFVASCLNFGALALLSEKDMGYISYYPAKAGYLAFVLGFACIGSMLNSFSRFNSQKTKKFFQSITTVLFVSVIWFSVSTTWNSQIDQYGFYSTKRVWDELRYSPPNPGRACFQRAMDITSDLNSNTDGRTILYLLDDLNTRWINGVRGRLTDATYSLSIPIGQGTQTLPEILEGWFKQFPFAQLLILSPEPPIGLDEWGDKIEYRQFSCT